MLNPILDPVATYTTGWDTGKDLVGTLERAFGDVETQRLHGGSLFIAVAVKA